MSHEIVHALWLRQIAAQMVREAEAIESRVKQSEV